MVENFFVKALNSLNINNEKNLSKDYPECIITIRKINGKARKWKPFDFTYRSEVYLVKASHLPTFIIEFISEKLFVV